MKICGANAAYETGFYNGTFKNKGCGIIWLIAIPEIVH